MNEHPEGLERHMVGEYMLGGLNVDDLPAVLKPGDPCPGCNGKSNWHFYRIGLSNLGSGWWHRAVIQEVAKRNAKAIIKKVFDRHSKLGSLRSARRHPAASRNEYHGRRAARNVARQVLGLRPEGVYR